MSKKLDNKLILNRIRSHYQVSKNQDLAKVLQIKPNTLANWIKRNTLNLPQLITVCEELNPNWIINGDGRPTKAYLNSEENNTTYFEDDLQHYGSAAMVDEINRLSKIVALQKETIAAQAKTIAVMEQLIERKM